MISGRRSHCHLASASLCGTLRSARLKETHVYLKPNETACIVNPTELDICITQRGIISDVDHNVNNEAGGPF